MAIYHAQPILLGGLFREITSLPMVMPLKSDASDLEDTLANNVASHRARTSV